MNIVERVHTVASVVRAAAAKRCGPRSELSDCSRNSTLLLGGGDGRERDISAYVLRVRFLRLTIRHDYDYYDRRSVRVLARILVLKNMSSNKRVYLSGAQKRKNKAQADENCKKLRKISSFLDSSPKCVSQKSTRQCSETCDNTKESTSTFE